MKSIRHRRISAPQLSRKLRQLNVSMEGDLMMRSFPPKEAVQ